MRMETSSISHRLNPGDYGIINEERIFTHPQETNNKIPIVDLTLVYCDCANLFLLSLQLPAFRL